MALLNLSTASGPAQLHAAVLGDGTFVEQQQPISGNVVGALTQTTVAAATATQVSFDATAFTLLTAVTVTNSGANLCYIGFGAVGGTPVTATRWLYPLSPGDAYSVEPGWFGAQVQVFSPNGTTMTTQRQGFI